MCLWHFGQNRNDLDDKRLTSIGKNEEFQIKTGEKLIWDKSVEDLPTHGLWLTMLKMRSHLFFMWLFGQMQPNIGERRKLVQESWHRSLKDNELRGCNFVESTPGTRSYMSPLRLNIALLSSLKGLFHLLRREWVMFWFISFETGQNVGNVQQVTIIDGNKELKIGVVVLILRRYLYTLPVLLSNEIAGDNC